MNVCEHGQNAQILYLSAKPPNQHYASMPDTLSPELKRLYESAAQVDSLGAVRVLWQLRRGEITKEQAESRLRKIAIKSSRHTNQADKVALR